MPRIQQLLSCVTCSHINSIQISVVVVFVFSHYLYLFICHLNETKFTFVATGKMKNSIPSWIWCGFHQFPIKIWRAWKYSNGTRFKDTFNDLNYAVPFNIFNWNERHAFIFICALCIQFRRKNKVFNIQSRTNSNVSIFVVFIVFLFLCWFHICECSSLVYYVIWFDRKACIFRFLSLFPSLPSLS